MYTRHVRFVYPECTPRTDQDISLTTPKAISRSDFSSRQAISPSPSNPRSKDGQSPPSTPHVNSFAESYDRYRERDERHEDDSKAGREESKSGHGDDGEGGRSEDEDDFRSAISEAGTGAATPRSRRSTVGGRVLNSPLPGRRTPRKLARRSIGNADEWNSAAKDESIAEQEASQETEE